MKEIIHTEPFPHLIIEDFYDEEELELIWEELNYYTKPGKLLGAKDYGGIADRTNAKALELDGVYQNYTKTGGPNYRNISNILTLNRKLFTSGVLETYSTIHDCCSLATDISSDATKVRYYHNDEFYKPHTDNQMTTLAFSYFYKEPKLFSGGELYFPKNDYELLCLNNSFIIFPGWVKHGVSKVKIANSDYYKGFGRYAITQFLVTTPWREERSEFATKTIP
tara:strand:- start:131 stop:799 length:669 start_codon:yes stop_codon:yes gene_type:complete